ncbi:hypothetical protein FRC04_003739 [Tulasnella sp. 424]|nr:hypothetical protein FRC04_003739 [Tulasnella sp. 424]KAG8977068.1 hypothetical protein FRC05_002589 [Tulasnella sp. 425]
MAAVLVDIDISSEESACLGLKGTPLPAYSLFGTRAFRPFWPPPNGGIMYTGLRNVPSAPPSCEANSEGGNTRIWSWRDHISAQFTDSDMVRREGSPPPPAENTTPLGGVIQNIPDSFFEPFGEAESNQGGTPVAGFRQFGEHFVEIAAGESGTFFIMAFHFVIPGFGSTEANVTVRKEVWRAPANSGPTDVPRSSASRVRALLLYLESVNYAGWAHI